MYWCSIRFSSLFIIAFYTIYYPAVGQIIHFEFSVGVLNEPCGGLSSARSLVHREFVYPETDLRKELDGLVVVSFALDRTGRVIHRRIDSATTPAMEAEAIRMFGLINWPPDHRRFIPDRATEKFFFTFRRKDWIGVYKKRKYMIPPQDFLPIDSSYKVYNPVHLDEQPAPIYKRGDYESYLEYITKQLVYPENARKLGLNGEVIMEWVVENSGRVSNLYIKQGLQGGCNEEAIRVLKTISWKPGIKNGLYVRTVMSAALGFGVPTRDIVPVAGQSVGGGN